TSESTSGSNFGPEAPVMPPLTQIPTQNLSDIILITMTKRAFLNLLSAAVASPVLAPLQAWMAKQRLTNWSGNITYGTDRVHEATSVEQIRSLVRSKEKVKALGTQHCFNSIADSRYNLL